MKRLLPFMLIALLAVGFSGTAFAQGSVTGGEVELNPATTSSGVSSVFWSPVVGKVIVGDGAGGTSAYVVGGAPSAFLSKQGDDSGVTLMAISTTVVSAAGYQLNAVPITDAGTDLLTGTTAIGGPQLLSGGTNWVVLYVQAVATNTVGNSTTDSGTSLYLVDHGNNRTVWQIGLPGTGLGVAAPANPSGIFDLANAGAAPYSLAPLTIDNESITTAGATIYGIIPGAQPAAGVGGASIFAINSATSAFTTNVNGESNVTGLYLAGLGGVSVVQAAPLIVDDNLFVVGYSALGTGGVSIVQYDKNNLVGVPGTIATVHLNADLSDQWVPTPTASGGSIFVVDNNGGVTAYAANDLSLAWGAGAVNGSFVNYAGNLSVGGVTASPVNNGTYIVLCGTGSVSAYPINRLSGNSAIWTYDFGAPRYTIDSTPAIATNVVYVTVNDNTTGTASIWAFRLQEGTPDGAPQIIQSGLAPTMADTLVVGNRVVTVSLDPTFQTIANAGVLANDSWPQYKVDKAKTGNNSPVAVPEPGDDGGCFISTIK